MSLSNISLDQALGVWSDLEQAYYGDNGYGSDTAEIYAYRLMRYVPTALHANAQGKRVVDDADMRGESLKAARALYELLYRFSEQRDCLIRINGEPLGEWLAFQPFDHRCHVRVARRAPGEPQ